MTPKQERFVQEYLIDLNATQAAIRAGYSEKTANEQGSRLLANVSVRAAIEAGQEKRSEKVEVTQEMVLAGLYEEATASGEGTSHAARVSAWAHLGKHLGMFIDKQETGEPGSFSRLSPEQRQERVLQLLSNAKKRKTA